MKATEYLKLCIQDGNILGVRKWLVSAFAILKLNKVSPSDTHLDLYTQEDGLYFSFIEEGVITPVKIEDYAKNAPLFVMQDLVKIDPSWLPTIKQPMEVKIGNIILNRFIIYDVFEERVGYITEKITPNLINKLLVERTVDEDKEDDYYIGTQRMIKCTDNLTYLSLLGTVINIAATRKSITPPPNIDKLKKIMLEKEPDILKGGVKAVEFEEALSKLDDEYLADDYAAQVILGKKQRGARKKMFLSYGQASNFEEQTKMITSSLQDGIDTDKDNFGAYMDDLRYGSYSRGGSTAKSGYIYKILQRALSSLLISNDLCDTTKGYTRLILKNNADQLANRFIKEKGKWKLIEGVEEGRAYIGKEVETRSALYCKTKGNSVCYGCMSTFYKDNEAGMSNLAANISDAFMTLFLKRMHASTVSTVDIDLNDLTQ